MSNRNLNTRALPVLLALLMSAGNPAVAIENGQPDRWNRNVGFMGFDTDGPAAPTPPFALCSGFVISDRAFVTAAHCIAAIPPELAQSWAVTLESGSPREPIVPPGVISLVTFNVTDFPILVETVSATAVHLHPEFDPATLANDVAILEFPSGTFSVRPVRLAEPHYLDMLQEKGLLARLPVLLSGYGADEDLGNWQFSIPGYRQWGFSAAAVLSDERLTLEPTSRFDARPLPGDSGSPQFVNRRVVSLESVADSQRLDIPVVRAFLAPYLAQ